MNLDSSVNEWIYIGIRIKDKLKVAMKFVKKEIEHEARKEYEMYTYLNAINNPKVEKYGIAAVYHYNENWNGYILMILSHFGDGNLQTRARENYFDHLKTYRNINTLIVFRDFVSHPSIPPLVCRPY